MTDLKIAPFVVVTGAQRARIVERFKTWLAGTDDREARNDRCRAAIHALDDQDLFVWWALIACTPYKDLHWAIAELDTVPFYIMENELIKRGYAPPQPPIKKITVEEFAEKMGRVGKIVDELP